MRKMAQSSGENAAEPSGRSRVRESPFLMIPADEAIGEVLKQAAPLEAVTMKLADIPPGIELRFRQGPN